MSTARTVSPRLRRSRRFIAWFTAFAALLTIAAIVVLHTRGDVDTIGTLLLFAPRRFLAVAWLLLGLLVAPIARKWAAFCLVAAGVSAVWFGGYVLPAWPSGGPVSTESSAPLRLVTFNVDHPTSLATLLASASDRWDADVIVMQACGGEAAADLSRATAATAPAQRRMRVTKVGEFCLASHLPYVVVALIGESERSDTRIRHPIGVHLRVARATDTVSIVAVHLSSPRDELGRALRFDLSGMPHMVEKRRGEALGLSRYLNRITEPLIVAGDFNMPQESQIYATYFAPFGNAFRDSGSGFGFTMHAGLHRLRIDHVLTSPRVRAVALEVEDHWPTEHFPVIADLVIR